MSKITYLAVMPKCRKPKAVPPRDAGFYRERARLFYEAPGLSAADARAAIAVGTLQPTYRDGVKVGSTDDAETAPTISALTRIAERWQEAGFPGAYNHARLWIGRKFATLQRHYGSLPGAPGPSWAWHWAGADGTVDVLYDPEPLKGRDIEAHYGCHVRLELLREDYERGRRTSDVGRPWATVREVWLDGRLGPMHW